jgi:hypothetical protein
VSRLSGWRLDLGLSFRILSALVVPTLLYVGTVGQSGLDTTNKNLCELLNKTFISWQFCNFNELFVLLWALAISALFIFLMLEALYVLFKRVQSNPRILDENLQKSLANHTAAVDLLKKTTEDEKASIGRLRRAIGRMNERSEKILATSDSALAVPVEISGNTSSKRRIAMIDVFEIAASQYGWDFYGQKKFRHIGFYLWTLPSWSRR